MKDGKLDAFEMEPELKRLKDSIDLSCVEDIEFLRHYVELLDQAYMQAAETNRMQKKQNRDLWDSNDRIMHELQAEIAELKAKARRPEPGSLALHAYKTEGRTVPASNFVGTITANVDGKMSDAEFRQFIRNTLPIVVYDYGDRFYPYEEEDQGKGPRPIEEVQKSDAPGV